MSKADNLKDFLTDVADAIRAKKGSTDLINPQNFSAEIAALSGGLEVIEMTETTATIEPNKVYIWGMVESLDITLGTSTGENDFFAFRFRCSKPTMTSVTVNGATWAEDTELDAQGKPVLDLGSWYQCEIKGGTSALYARLAHYIPFADSNVEAVLLAKGVGDGIGITYADAAKVTTISTWFKANAGITSFDELINFTKLKSIGGSAFEACTNIAHITFPPNITTISPYAMKGCKSLEKIILPEKVTSLGYECFNNCESATILEFKSQLKTIQQTSFSNNKKLSEVIGFENTIITDTSWNTFANCSSLQKIILPETLTKISGSVFKGCSSLQRITIPKAVTIIEGSAFNGCSSLQRIILKPTTPPTLQSTSAIPSTIGAIYVPDESIGAYQAATNWSSFASKIKGISEMPTE